VGPFCWDLNLEIITTPTWRKWLTSKKHKEKFKDDKRITSSLKSKDRQYNDHKKNDKHFHKTLHKIIKTEQHKPHKNLEVNSGASEGKQYQAVSTKLHWLKSN
jgi:hypothetical protein